MSELTSQQLAEYIQQAQSLYHRLLVLVLPHKIGRHNFLYALAEEAGCEVANINLELSRPLIDLTYRQRKLQLAQVFEDIAERFTIDHEVLGSLVFLDNIEILFDPSLDIQVLNLLQRASRVRMVITTWPGMLIDNSIQYAEPGYPEYKRYPVKEFFAFAAD